MIKYILIFFIFIVTELYIFRENKSIQRLLFTIVPRVNIKLSYQLFISVIRLFATSYFILEAFRSLKGNINILDLIITEIMMVFAIVLVAFIIMVFLYEFKLHLDSRKIFSKFRYFDVDNKNIALTFISIIFISFSEWGFYISSINVGCIYLTIFCYTLYKTVRQKELYTIVYSALITLFISLFVYLSFVSFGSFGSLITIIIFNFILGFKEKNV